MAHFSEDLPADIQDYMSTLAELNIFLTGKTGFKATVRRTEAFIMSPTLLVVSVWWCLSVLALFKPCDWSTRFMKFILAQLSLVRIRALSDHPRVCPE